jgi:hypothetical protein
MSYCVLAQHHDQESSCCFQKCNRNSRHRCLYNDLSESLYTHLHPLLAVDEVSVESLQFVNATHEEGDRLMLCD